VVADRKCLFGKEKVLCRTSFSQAGRLVIEARVFRAAGAEGKRAVPQRAIDEQAVRTPTNCGMTRSRAGFALAGRTRPGRIAGDLRRAAVRICDQFVRGHQRRGLPARSPADGQGAERFRSGVFAPGVRRRERSVGRGGQLEGVGRAPEAGPVAMIFERPPC